MTKQSGFTLIELLIAVAIIGILASVAYPAYTNYVQTARRSAAKVTISAIANDLERYYTRNNSYVGWNNGAAYPSDKYTFTVTGITATAFKISATPTTTDACGVLSMDQTGQGSPANCW